MPEAGYITLSRKFFTHFLWNEDREFSRAEAWLDMIRMATFRDETVLIQGRSLSLHVGELAASVRYLNERWGWSKSKVERFLHTLEKNRMIETRTETGHTVISLSNYARYNTTRDIDEDNDGTEAGQRRDESKNGKHPRTQSSATSRKALPITDDWLQEMANRYPYINVPNEFTKAQSWIEAHPGRTLGRAFFVNWLNKIPPPPKTTKPAGNDTGDFWGGQSPS
ncbi:MAG TPA: hypothetical protein VD994_09155 [Prosthecobacter sp.]|nr:hypothetical protein [Prosthecobacter sp.]